MENVPSVSNATMHADSIFLCISCSFAVAIMRDDVLSNIVSLLGTRHTRMR